MEKNGEMVCRNPSGLSHLQKRFSQRSKEKSVHSGYFSSLPQFYVLAHILHNLGSVVMDISLFHWRPYFSLCYFCLLSVGSYEL